MGKEHTMRPLAGILAAALITVISYYLKPLVGLGAPMIALIIGMLLASSIDPERLSPLKAGLKIAQSKGLELSIILLGFSIYFADFKDAAKYFSVIPLIVLASLFLSYKISRLLGLTSYQAALISFGNSICGSSAIAAAGKIIKAPAIFVKAILFRFKNTPIEVVVSPNSIKIKQKDIVKSRVLINSSLDNPPLVFMLLKLKVDKYSSISLEAPCCEICAAACSFLVSIER